MILDSSPLWKTRLDAYRSLRSRAECKVGHIMFLFHSKNSNVAEARASLTTMLGLSDSKEFTKWFANKVGFLKIKESKLIQARDRQKVVEFYSSPIDIPVISGEAVDAPSSLVLLPARNFSPTRAPLSNVPSLAETPCTLLRKLSFKSTASPSTSSSLSFPPPPPGFSHLSFPPPHPGITHSLSESPSLASSQSLLSSSFLPPSLVNSHVPSSPTLSSLPSSIPFSLLDHSYFSSPSSSLAVSPPPSSSSHSHSLPPSDPSVHPSSSHPIAHSSFPIHSSLPPSSSSHLIPHSSFPLHSSFPPSSSPHLIPLSASPTRSSLPPSSPSPSHSPGPSPTKSARISIPVATPRGRGTGVRGGRRPLPPPPTPLDESEIPDDSSATAHWKKKLFEKGQLVDRMRRLKNEYGRKLRTALKHMGVTSIEALPKVPGPVSPMELKLAKEVSQLKRKLRQKRAPLSSPVAPKLFLAKTSDGYRSEVKYASLRLTTLGVSDAKQGQVMDVVAQMLDVRINETPCESTVRSWVPAIALLNRMHQAEVLEQNKEGLTLLRDETTKKGDKIQQHAVSLESKRILYLGFTAVPDKSALTAFDSLRARVESLAPFSSSSSPSQLFHQFVCKITNLMSDRASTEILFNKIFKSVRDRFLELKEGWSSLTPEEQEKAQLLLVHYCQLHSVSNLFGVVSREMVLHESESRQHPVDSSTAGFATVIREIPRYLSSRSAGGHREHREWKEWGKKVGITDTTMPALQGHRFNIQFLIAARIFMQREFILKFIEYAPKTMEDLDRLLRDELVLVQLQILGLLDQKITGPLWRIAENLGVIEGGQYHRDLLIFVDACIGNPSLFFSGECPTISIPPSFELFREEGILMRSLVDSSPSPLALDVAVRVLRSCASYLKDVLSQTMAGGIYSNPTDEVVESAQSAPATNRAVESAFAYMDYLYRRSPNTRFFRYDAITCFVLNHVAEWLDGKSTRERTLILEKALKGRNEIVREEQKRADQLGEAIVRKMEAEKVDYERKVLRSDVRKSKITQELGTTGLLYTESMIDCAIHGLRQSDAINLIKGQLRYRKKVLGQVATHRMSYRFSEGGVQLSLDTLVSHLKELVGADSTSGALEEDDFRSFYLGRTCELTCDITLSDGNVIDGECTIDNIISDGSGEVTIHLNGSSGIFTISRSLFEDLINDDAIVPL
ncbi:hypothetical protein PRIPAC_74248 [Pristionchus pacificus]|uniref:Uncharacterized protein n=1 Tax=Pristionchus pacificus TaxID=54126 RepID=A0A2A6BG41_PRIPA|nr:hypothetical protein PRIPAC_74248 [Pristionchus pacificus]|eukprot:PDM64852.1 hypothetical protein PRIPAC_53108 [Pristionchus pacificus]